MGENDAKVNWEWAGAPTVSDAIDHFWLSTTDSGTKLSNVLATNTQAEGSWHLGLDAMLGFGGDGVFWEVQER